VTLAMMPTVPRPPSTYQRSAGADPRTVDGSPTRV
jgi:hypothetical protein